MSESEPVPRVANPPAPDVPPVPLPAPMSVRVKAVYWAPSTYLRGHLILNGLAFAAIAASMFFQAERYTFTTNRGLLFLLGFLTAKEWAGVWAVVAALKLIASAIYPKLARVAVLLGMLLFSWWAAGFVLAWLFGRATILGLVAWGLIVGQHFAALTLIDGRRSWRDED